MAVDIDEDYRPSDHEAFMNERQREYFRKKLLAWKDEILRESRETLNHLQEESQNHPDLADRASSETDRAIELRARDRQRKLISKIDAALKRLEDGSYGYCEETGDPISLKRLDARPIATLSIEAQERHERRERVYRDDSVRTSRPGSAAILERSDDGAVRSAPGPVVTRAGAGLDAGRPLAETVAARDLPRSNDASPEGRRRPPGMAAVSQRSPAAAPPCSPAEPARTPAGAIARASMVRASIVRASVVVAALACAVAATAVTGLPAPSVVRADGGGSPADGAVAAALGASLFIDPRLSPDGRFSCASCHRPEAAFAEPGVARQRGRDGRPLATNAPSLVGLSGRGPYRHDGAAPTLAAQVAVPLLGANEMANPSLAAVAARLSADPATVAGFEATFGGGPTGERVVAALAGYLRTLAPAPSPYDRFRAGEATALSPAARRGLALFRGSAGCAACHLLDGTFRDGRFHDTGIAARRARRPFPDGVRPSEGRSAVTGDPADRYRVRTPGLGTVAQTAPYMHDGSIRTLDAVVRYYAAGGSAHAGLSPLIRPFAVDDGDVADLVAFLKELSGDVPGGTGQGPRPVSAAPAE